MCSSSLSPRDFEFPASGLVLSLTAAAVLSVLYLGLSWWLTGRTFGDRLMGLRIVDRHGRDLPMGAALLRALFCIVFPVDLLWAAVSRENRSVQDLVLRTSVVYHW